MSDKPEKEDANRQRHHSIDQIEQLQLPKRSDKRRRVYVGEQLQVWLQFGAWEAQVDVIDLSSQGLALVDLPENKKFPCAVGQKITLQFAKGSEQSFAIDAEVSNLSPAHFANKDYLRIGVRFQTRTCINVEKYQEQISEGLVACQGGIRPQAYCADPFFYQEVIIFQVAGFSASGLDLQVSARCKSLLPNLPFELDCYIPGRGRFLVSVRNSDLYLRSKGNHYRIFVKFVRAEKAFLEAVSEYLVMFSPAAPPNKLRELGFTLGDLSHAFVVDSTPVSEAVLADARLQSTPLAPPLFLTGSPLGSRSLFCKLGPHFVATLGLVFVLGDSAKSQLQGASHQIQKTVMAEKHIELLGLYLNPDIMLVDVLLPLLQNVMRIAVQAKARHLILECSAPLRSILLKMGFKEHGSQVQRKAEDGTLQTFYLLELALSQAILNQQRLIPQQVWQKVYKELFEFFKKQLQQQKLAAKSKA